MVSDSNTLSHLSEWKKWLILGRIVSLRLENWESFNCVQIKLFPWEILETIYLIANKSALPRLITLQTTDLFQSIYISWFQVFLSNADDSSIYWQRWLFCFIVIICFHSVKWFQILLAFMILFKMNHLFAQNLALNNSQR